MFVIPLRVFLTFATVGIPAAFAYCAAPLATNVVGHIRPSGSSPTADAFARRAATRIGFFISDVAATAPYLIGRRKKKVVGKSGGKRVGKSGEWASECAAACYHSTELRCVSTSMLSLSPSTSLVSCCDCVSVFLSSKTSSWAAWAASTSPRFM